MREFTGPEFVECHDSMFKQQGEHFLQVWILMEFCQRGDLSKHIEQSNGQRMPEEEIGRMLTPILEGLRQMHAKNMLHRDVKPANILISDDNRGKLADFGFAKRIQNAEENQDNTRVVGTPQYMAPEINSGRYSASIDVFAFGVVLLNACGVKFDGPGFPGWDEKRVAEHIERIPNEYSDELKNAIRSALTIHSEDDQRADIRPSSRELLMGPFFKRFSTSPAEDVLRKARSGPWADLSNTVGLDWDGGRSGARMSRNGDFTKEVEALRLTAFTSEITGILNRQQYKADMAELSEEEKASLEPSALAGVNTLRPAKKLLVVSSPEYGPDGQGPRLQWPSEGGSAQRMSGRISHRNGLH